MPYCAKSFLCEGQGLKNKNACRTNVLWFFEMPALILFPCIYLPDRSSGKTFLMKIWSRSLFLGKALKSWLYQIHAYTQLCLTSLTPIHCLQPYPTLDPFFLKLDHWTFVLATSLTKTAVNWNRNHVKTSGFFPGCPSTHLCARNFINYV